MLKITINGNLTEIETTSLVEYFKNKEINPDSVIVLLNDNIIKKNNLKDIILQENDSLEIVKFVGGG